MLENHTFELREIPADAPYYVRTWTLFVDGTSTNWYMGELPDTNPTIDKGRFHFIGTGTDEGRYHDFDLAKRAFIAAYWDANAFAHEKKSQT